MASLSFACTSFLASAYATRSDANPWRTRTSTARATTTSGRRGLLMRSSITNFVVLAGSNHELDSTVLRTSTGCPVVGDRDALSITLGDHSRRIDALSD